MQQTLLVIGAHPDDETIYCAGLIFQALARGDQVAVVTMTNGDADQKAAVVMSGRSAAELEAADYLNLANQRQRQELEALGVLGLSQGAVNFLGYPDGGLTSVEQTRGESPPYIHPLTRKASTYGETKRDYHAEVHGVSGRYVYENALADVIALVQALKPTQVFTHNTSEPHPDHQMTYRLVREALRRVGYAGQAYMFYNDTDAFASTVAMSVPLSDDQARIKHQALLAHAYQIQVAPAILKSTQIPERFVEMLLVD